VEDGDGNLLCTTQVGADGTWSCKIPDDKALPEGPSELVVTETDPAGNVSDSTRVPVNVDSTIPLAPVVDATNGTQLNGSAPLAEAGDQVVLSVDGAVVPGCEKVTVGADGRFSCRPTTPVANGAVVSAHLVDPAGNVGPQAVSVVAGIGIRIEHATRYATDPQLVTGVNFHPGERVVGMVYSKPISLGTVSADEFGVATFPVFTLPADFEPGTHTVVLTGTGCLDDSCAASGVVSDTFQVLKPTPGKVIDTGIPGLGASQTTALGIGMLAASALLGIFLLLVGRNRREEVDEQLHIR
jgi:hypothetical protein